MFSFSSRLPNILRNSYSSRSYHYNRACLNINNIRNVGIVAHIDAGKTTTTENMLYLCGVIRQLGRVDGGDTTMDYLPQERERGITISAATTRMNWKNYIVNVIDTPGHVDFTFEVSRSSRVLDGCVVIVDAVSGVQAQTQTVWRQTVDKKPSIGQVFNNQTHGLPAIGFVNKMDRTGADFKQCILSMEQKLGRDRHAIVPIQLPIGAEETFTGVVDLIGLNSMVYPSHSSSRNPLSPVVTPIDTDDAHYKEHILEAREHLLSTLAENDEEFLDMYLEHEDECGSLKIPVEDILNTITRLCHKGLIIPVLCGASLRGKGVEPVLESICRFLPAPNTEKQGKPSIVLMRKEKDTNAKTNMTTTTESVHINCSNSNINSTHEPGNYRYLMANEQEPLSAMIFKIVHDPNKGALAFVRVFSGVLHSKSMIYNSTKDCKERVHQLGLVVADDLELLESIGAGNVGCIIGLKHASTGDTLMEVQSKTLPPTAILDGGSGNNTGNNKKDLGNMHDYILDGLPIPEPVFALSIEPEKVSQQPLLDKALSILSTEDPSLRVETDPDSGLTMLRGLGELHLEIVLDKLKRTYNLHVDTGNAYVGYKETLGLNHLPDRKLVESFVLDKMLGVKPLYANITFEVVQLSSSESKSKSEDGSDVNDYTLKPQYSISSDCLTSLNKIVSSASASDVLNTINETLETSFTRGLGGYPITGIGLKIIDIEEGHPDCSLGSLRACISAFVHSLFRNNEYYIKLEPIMSIEVSVPRKFVGEVLNDLCTKRRAAVKEVGEESVTGPSGGLEEEQMQVILGEVPLITMLGYATAIRSMTQGEGSFSMEYVHHAPTSE